ncbi:MAG TPA: hypothetical protein VNK23_00635 [Candidatus Dormibacteraeota bacterium]|nr:hypothetical protein [Candidatus Dormibacteraeota bacterium]
MLKSRRIEAAPTLGHLLTRTEPRKEVPAISYPTGKPTKHHMGLAPNDLQKGLMVSFAHRIGLRGGIKLLSNVHHRQHIADFFEEYRDRRVRKND